MPAPRSITRIGNRVILEPIEAAAEPMPWAEIDALGDKPFMPEGRELPETPSDRDIFGWMIHTARNADRPL